MEWPASIFVVFCLCSSALSCSVYENGKLIPNNDLPYQHLQVKDVQPTGVQLLEYTTDGIMGIGVPDNILVDIQFQDNTITVMLNSTFSSYEEDNTIQEFYFTFSLHCNDSSEHLTMGFTFHINDTDNHDPEFNQTSDLIYSIPMPYPPGVEITHEYDIWAYDFDFTSDLEISATGNNTGLMNFKTVEITERPFWNEHDKKKFYGFHIISKVQLDIHEDLKYTLTAKDRNNPDKTATRLVTIKRNSTFSVPDSPVFKKPVYKTKVYYEMEPGDKLPIPEEIRLTNYDSHSVDITMGDEENVKYFKVFTTSDGGVEIHLKEKITDVNIRYALFTLKASVTNAKYVGYTAVYVEFPEMTCPITTPCPEITCPTEPTTPTTTETPSTTPETTIDPCSLCPTQTPQSCPTQPECTCPTVTEVTCATEPLTTTPTETPSTTHETTIDPCSLCPTQPECTCPTITEVQCPTTHEPSSCPPCVHSTPNWTTTTEETTVQAHSCPTCPETTTCPECDCTTVYLSTKNTDTTGKTTGSPMSTSAMTDTTGHDCNCSSCPQVTCTPCDNWSSTTKLPQSSPSTPSETVTCTPCPEVTCPSIQTTTGVEQTTNSHSNYISTTHHTGSSFGTHATGNYTEGTSGSTTQSTGLTSPITTTGGSSFSSSTQDDGSSTTVCNCPTCPQVTCPSIQTTTGVEQTTNSHSNSISTTHHTGSSFGTHATGNYTEGTSGSTTQSTGLTSPITTTGGSTFSSSTQDDGSSTTVCNCPTCPQVTECPPCHWTSPFTTTNQTFSTGRSSESSITVTDTTGKTTTCPECDCTTVYLSSKNTDKTGKTTESATDMTDTTGHDFNCSSCPQVTCTPCDNCSSTTKLPHSSPSTPSETVTCTPCPETTSPACDCTTTPAANTGDSTGMSPLSTQEHKNSSLTPPDSSTTCPPTTTCPECDCTTVYLSTKNTDTAGKTTGSPMSTSAMTDTTGHDCNCSSCPQVTCTPCDNWSSTTKLPQSSPYTPSETVTCTPCPEVTCTPCDNWSSTTKLPHSSPSTPSETVTCTPCPECPGSTTPNQGPPVDSYLTFPVEIYGQQFNGDTGHITWITAQPHPSNLLKWGSIEYKLEGLPNELEGVVDITLSGELIALTQVKVGDYHFNVTAEICRITKKAEAMVYLSVVFMETCANGTDVDVIFPVSFISTSVPENHNDIIKKIQLPDGVNCNFTVMETPTKGKIQVQKMSPGIVISLLSVDREDPIFKGATTPTIHAEISATCSMKLEENALPYLKGSGNDVSVGQGVLTILIYIKDEDDCPPTFNSDKMVIGYPEKDIADEERPPHMGIAVAHDNDLGPNAKFTYSVAKTEEVIIDAESGYFYPHPKYFEYKNISFDIIASDTNSKFQNEMEVIVKILSPKYITVMGIEGATLEDVSNVTAVIAEKTGLQIGVISARVESVNSKHFKSRFLFNQEHMRPKKHLLSEEIISSNNDAAKTPREDDTIYLRLVIYALNDSNPVNVMQFNSSVNGIQYPYKWNVQVYRTEGYERNSSESGSGGLLAAVIAVSTILGILLLGIVGFVTYRKRRAIRAFGSGSIEKGLVDENSGSDNGVIEENNGSVIFKSESDSVHSETDLGMDENPDMEETSPERRKSVAFAEEPEVIPSEEELEAIPVEGNKGEDVPEDEDEEDERM